LVVICDTLKGLPEGVESVWPQAWVQTCIVHLMRNSLHLVSCKDRTHVAAALKAIYPAADEQAAATLEDFEAVWAARCPGIPHMPGNRSSASWPSRPRSAP
jgi:putative transposase